MPNKKILLDMDGLLTNWLEGVLKAHGRPDPFDNPENIGKFDVDKMWGMTPDEFWLPLNNPSFWENLAPSNEASLIVSAAYMAVGATNVAICSSPSRGEGCIDGKLRWIKKYFPSFLQNGRRVIFAPCKEFCASPYRLLIDDYDKNVDLFAEEGGCAYLYPRPWNANHRNQPYAIGLMEQAIDTFVHGISL
jgi:5'(3')-deoxyribonucleotidase